jgi:C4-dicarboxylate-binding protein DctP
MAAMLPNRGYLTARVIDDYPAEMLNPGIEETPMKPMLFATIAVLSLLVTACGARGAAPASTASGPQSSAAAAAPASGAVSAAGGATMTIKFNHVVTRDTPKGRASDRFAELVKQSSNGRMTVQVFPNSELYKDGEEVEALQQGAINFIAPGIDKYGVLIPKWEAPALPYLFLSDAAGKKFIEPGNAVAKELNESLRDKGMLGLGIWLNGWKHFSDSKRPLIQPDDLKGLKFRTSGKPDEAFVKALGGSAQVMAFSEVFGALQQGVVDGQYNSWSNIYSQKFHEVQKYATVSRGGALLTYGLATNAKWWDGLAAADRKILSDALDEATRFNNKIADDDNNQAFDAIKKTNRMDIHEQTEAEAKAWAVAADAVTKEWEPRTGKDIIDKLKALN